MLGASDQDPEQTKARQDLLLKVYGAALDECRFNIQLGWDRTKFFLTISVTAIAAGIGLMKVAGDAAAIYFFLSLYFMLLIGVTYFGGETISKSKQYYREAIRIKTLVERELGLLREAEGLHDPTLNLSIAVTPGQRNFLRVLFDHTSRKVKRPDRGSVVERVEWIFGILIAIEVLGAIWAWVLGRYYLLPRW